MRPLTSTNLSRVIFTAQLVLAILSCLPNDDTRAKQEERREKHETLEELKSLKSPVYATHGFDSVMTPRTSAFNQLNGTMDLPLRHPSSTLNNSQNSTPDLKDVKDVDAIEVVPPVPPVPQFHQEQFVQAHEPQYAPELQHLRQAHPQPEPQQQPQPQPHPEQQPQTQTQPAMYFPPPPRKVSKSKK